MIKALQALAPGSAPAAAVIHRAGRDPRGSMRLREQERPEHQRHLKPTASAASPATRALCSRHRAGRRRTLLWSAAAASPWNPWPSPSASNPPSALRPRRLLRLAVPVSPEPGARATKSGQTAGLAERDYPVPGTLGG